MTQIDLVENFFITSRTITNEKMEKKKGLISECKLLTAKYKVALDKAVPYYLYRQG